MEKTKILAIGDIHGDTGLVQKLAEKAIEENIDLIILAGDITFAEQSTENLIGPFAKAKKKVLLIPGNHESIATIDFLANAYENAKNIHGYGIQHKNIGIFGAGTANVGIHQIGDENIFKVLEKAHQDIKDAEKKIMVTHLHPEGSKSEIIFGGGGSKAIRKAMDKFKPDILINAHVHEAGGIEEMIDKTLVINVARTVKIFEI